MVVPEKDNFVSRLIKKVTTDNLIKNGSWLFTRNIVTAFSVILLSIVAANFLDPNVYGIYKYILSIGAIISIFGLTGAREAIVRSLAKHGSINLPKIFKSHLTFSILPHLLLFLISAYYLWQENYVFSFCFALIAVTQPFYQAAELYRATLNGLQKHKVLALTSIFFTLSTSSIVMFMMWKFGTVIAITSSYVISHTTLSLLLYFITLEKNKKSCTGVRSPNILGYSINLSVMKVFSRIADNLENVLIFQILSPATLAVFTFAKAPVDQILSQSNIVKFLVLPRFSRYSSKTVRSNIHYKAIWFFTLVLFSLIIYLLAIPSIFELLFPKYLESIVYSQILALSILGVPGILYYEALTASQQTKQLYLIETLAPGIKICLLLIGGFLFGLIGFVIAITISYIFRNILIISLYTLRKPSQNE